MTSSFTPYLSVPDSAAAVDFYEKAFGATKRYWLTAPGGAVVHCEMDLGGHSLMLADESPDFGNVSPATLGGTTVRLALEVDDVDAVFARAIDAGAESLMDVSDQFYGQRAGRLKDPFGHIWIVSSVIEEVDPEEMQKRADALFGDGG